MEFRGKLKDIARNWNDNKLLVTFELENGVAASFDKVANKLLNITVKQHRNRRSLDANAYAWVLMQKIAESIKTDKWSVYLEMLESYGVFTHVIVKPSVVERVVQEWRTVKNLGEIKVGGRTGIQLQCYFGSSTYDTKEMTVFIDGIVRECKELEIDIISPDELEKMKQEWGIKFEEVV